MQSKWLTSAKYALILEDIEKALWFSQDTGAFSRPSFIEAKFIMTQQTLEPQISPATCASCPYFQAHNDGTNKGWCGLFNHFAREHHVQTQDCVNTIRESVSGVGFRPVELTNPEGDEQEEVNQEVNQQVLELAPEYEIDSVDDAQFGELFRLWKGWQFAGSFYKAHDGKWIAQPIKAEINGRFSTHTQAILILVTIFETPELQVA
ncbi:MAG: hypothetical protein KME29_31580 [Calothrix sp. FI2-JRJ7]|nr:hypothetical protein [Calothrix sp. FI2-JRJ7]